jgi:hypothetical protein
MKSLLGLLAIVLLSVSPAACGGSSGDSSSGSHASATKAPVKLDRDNDGDKNDDDAHVLYYGEAAMGSERQAITTLLKQYYAAAAAADGAKACTLLMPFIAESVAENYGHSAALRGKTCAVVMSKLFKQHHQVLSGENATLKFLTVRVEGGRGLTVMSFSTLPEVRQISERRDGSTWKVLQLLDGIIE